MDESIPLTDPIRRGWPFPDIPQQRFDGLNDRQRLEIQGAVRCMIRDFESNAPQEKPRPRVARTARIYDFAARRVRK